MTDTPLARSIQTRNYRKIATMEERIFRGARSASTPLLEANSSFDLGHATKQAVAMSCDSVNLVKLLASTMA
jgi:hypothetical protein